MFIFTWNLQRSPIMGENFNNIEKIYVDLRLSTLSFLIEHCDFGFVTEPGADIRDGTNHGRFAAFPGTTWTRDRRSDNQNDLSACRPLLVSKQPPGYQLQLEVQSGGDMAFRHPAGGGFRVQNHNLMVISMHSTAGGGGANNTKEMVDALNKHGKDRGMDAVLVGGDFNSRNGIDDGNFCMPDGATNQSANPKDPKPLDGFFVKNVANSSKLRLSNARTLHQLDPANYKLILVSEAVEGLSKAGFAKLNPADNHWYRLSDHAPVIAELSFE